MGKPGGAGAGAGWLATVRKVFKPSKDQRHAKKHKGGELDSTAAGGGDAAEIVSVDHFPTAETSPEVTNEWSGGAVGWREREYQAEVAGASSTIRGRRGAMTAVTTTAASRVPRTAFARRRTSSREEFAAMRIQAYYRGYLARRARRALRGLVRLQALVRGHQVRRQVHITMRCMQALVRAQDRVRACRLTYDPNVARRRAGYRPGLVDHVPAGHGLLGQLQRGRSSFGYDRVGMDETELSMMHSVQMQAPQRHSNGSRGSWQGTRDALRTHGVPRGHTVPAAWSDSAPTYAYGLQHQRQLDELEDRDEPSVGWHCLEHCDTGVQAQQHAPGQGNNQHRPAESSYVAAAATDGVWDSTLETEAASSRKSPARDLYPVRPPPIPGYMAATQSARAKARMAPPAAARADSRSRSGLVMPSGRST